MKGIFLENVKLTELADMVAEKVCQRQSERQPVVSKSALISESDEFLNTEEVCKILDISRSTLQRYVQEGLPSSKIRRRCIYRRSDIDSWVESKKKAQ